MFYPPYLYDLVLFLSGLLFLFYCLVYVQIGLLFTLIYIQGIASPMNRYSQQQRKMNQPEENSYQHVVEVTDRPGLPPENDFQNQPPLRPTLGGLVAAATYQGSKPYNHDCFWYGGFGPCNVLLIADGVSSSTFPDVAARQIKSSLYHAIQQAVIQPQPVLDQAFFRTVCQEAVQLIAHEVPANATADTTFIALVELANRFVLTYLGDGGIVRTRGNRRDGKSMLLAHHDECGLLSGYVGAQAVVGTPTVIELSKSELSDGEILLIGTDGALPPRKELLHTVNLLEELFQQSQSWQGVFTSAQIAQVIAEYLQRCDPDDNATLGVLFTQEALAYWQHSYLNRQGEEHANPSCSLAADKQ